jgi:hypothetical protein
MDEGFIDGVRLAMAGRTKCCICGGTEWRGFAKQIDGKPTRLVLGAVWPDGTPVSDYGFEVIASACTQCGGLRLMVADLLSLTTGDFDTDPDTDPEAEPHDADS